MRWRVYYGDGSTFSDRDGEPFDAAPAGVQVVVGEAPGGHRIMQGKDTYYWDPGMGWCPCDLAGLFDYLMLRTGPKAVLFGRSIRDDLFWSTVARATREGLG